MRRYKRKKAEARGCLAYIFARLCHLVTLGPCRGGGGRGGGGGAGGILNNIRDIQVEEQAADEARLGARRKIASAQPPVSYNVAHNSVKMGDKAHKQVTQLLQSNSRGILKADDFPSLGKAAKKLTKVSEELTLTNQNFVQKEEGWDLRQLPSIPRPRHTSTNPFNPFRHSKFFEAEDAYEMRGLVPGEEALYADIGPVKDIAKTEV